MKLLKLVFIICIILQSAAIAYSASNKIIYHNVGMDTVKHKRRHRLPPPPSSARYAKELPYNDCMFVKRYSVAQRLKQYPFSRAAKIMIVSYPSWYPDEPINLTHDTVKEYTIKKDNRKPLKFIDSIFPAGLHIMNGELNHSSLKEVRYLDQQQINSLTNILYNTTYKKKNNIVDMGHSCFNPRNAFIFLDDKGKIFDYLEVCFECERMESLSDRIWFKTGCNQQLDYLKKFLIKTGIRYGTIERRDYLFTK